MAFGDRVLSQVPPRKIAIGIIALVAVALFVHKASLAVGDPFFAGDAGHRMNYAGSPVAPMDNRVWLPALQTHICAFYYAHLPIPAFKLISPSYLFIAVFILGWFAYRYTGETYTSLGVALLLMVCFAFQHIMTFLSTHLYQEMMAAALLFSLLWGGALELRKSRWLLLAGCAAMLTRDTFWIYLFVLTALNLKTILHDSKLRLSFLLLWAIPALWLLSIPVAYLLFLGRPPELPMEWPLMVNKSNNAAIASLGASARGLLNSLIRGQVFPILAGVGVAWLIGRLWQQPSSDASGKTDSFLARFAPFSLLSLGIIYTLIFLFDPWQIAGGSMRVGAPLIAHAFVWVMILFKISAGYRPRWRALARVALAAGMIIVVDTRAESWIPTDYSQDRRAHAEIKAIIDEVGRDHTPMVCFAGQRYFKATEYFLAPSFRAKKWVKGPDADVAGRGCEVFIVPQEHTYQPGDDYRLRGTWTVNKERFRVHQRVERD